MPVQTISLDDIRRVRDSGAALNLIDVRTPVEFDRIHAQGARSVPLDELDPIAIDARRSDSNEAIYVICQAGARAAKACERFAAAGVTPVFSIEGGTAAWERAGLPVVRSQSKVISLERQVRIGAGSLVLLGVILGWLVHPIFLALAAFVGAGLVFAGATDWCGMALLLAKMPWNRRKDDGACGKACSA